jgi:hypothetical protein
VRRPTSRAPYVSPISLFPDADCRYEARLTKGSSLVALATGRGVAGVRKRIGLTEALLPRGTYRITIRVTATDFRATPFRLSRTFSI